MIVITGAAGFIGQHLVRDLLKRTRERIICLDNLHRGQWGDLCDLAQNGQLQLQEDDVRNPKVLQTAFKGVQTIYHLAAQSNVLGAVSDISYSFETNVVGTFNVLRAAKSAGVRCVVFTSSREVYGEPRTLPVDENSLLTPKNAYGASKVAAEAYCRVFDSPEMRVVILRLSNVYGLGDRDRVIPIFAERVKQRLPLVLYGGEQVLDLVPMELVVEALWRAAEKQPTEPINIGSGKGTSIKALAQRMLELSGLPVKWELAPARSIEVVRFVASVERMHKWLELTPPDDPLSQLPLVLAQ
jgi:UDP-glucose 4-epimerase